MSQLTYDGGNNSNNDMLSFSNIANNSTVSATDFNNISNMLYSSQAKKGVAERLERGGFVTDNRYREIPVANEIARLLLWQRS